MSAIIHSNHHNILHNVKEEFDEQKNKSLKIVCSDGTIFCDRLLFVLWSKFWKTLLNPEESENTVIIHYDSKWRYFHKMFRQLV